MISIIRGDNKSFKLTRETKDGNVIDEVVDKMYFTVKRNVHLEKCLFQKTLDNGITYDSANKCYIIEITPDDTNDLSFDTYSYDVEVIKDGKTKTLIVDTLQIKEEVTYQENEV